jgi:hypothetical protein
MPFSIGRFGKMIITRMTLIKMANGIMLASKVELMHCKLFLSGRFQFLSVNIGEAVNTCQHTTGWQYL